MRTIAAVERMQHHSPLRGMPPQEYDGAMELADTCFVQWLGVPADKSNLTQTGYDARAPEQGKGLGKRLLARSLVEMHARGYTRAIISTALGNHRAQLFYVRSSPDY